MITFVDYSITSSKAVIFTFVFNTNRDKKQSFFPFKRIGKFLLFGSGLAGSMSGHHNAVRKCGKRPPKVCQVFAAKVLSSLCQIKFVNFFK